MFPLPWNFPFRKKNGNLVNLGDAIDGGTEIPEHDEGDAGKVLSVDENGDLQWSDAETDIPEYGSSDEGKVLSVDSNGDLEWSEKVEQLSESIGTLSETVSSIGGSLVSNWSGSGVNVITSTMKDNTLQGIAFTVNEDKTIRAVGTSLTGFGPQIGTAKLKAGITYKIFDTINEVVGSSDAFIVAMDANNTILMGSIGTEQYPNEYTPMLDIDVKVSFIILPNVTLDKLFFPSIIDSSIDPGSYVVPAKSNAQLTAENQTLTNLTDILVNNGVVNVLENTATTQTVGSEVTYTVNVDKTVTATFTSSPTESRNLDVCGSFTIDKAMHLSGCPSGGGQGVYRLFAKLSNASTYYNDDENGVLLPAGSYDYIRITVGTSASASSSPLVFKPMISDPILNLSYGDYVPYAKTNRELTEDIASGYLISSTYVNVTVTADGIKTYKELLTELFTKIDTTQQEQNYEYFIFAWLIIDGNSALNVNGLRPYSRSATTTFFEVGSDSSALKIAHIEFKATTSTYHYAEIGSSVTFTDKTDTVPAVSSVITARLYKCVPQNMS